MTHIRAAEVHILDLFFEMLNIVLRELCMLLSHLLSIRHLLLLVLLIDHVVLLLEHLEKSLLVLLSKYGALSRILAWWRSLHCHLGYLLVCAIVDHSLASESCRRREILLALSMRVILLWLKSLRLTSRKLVVMFTT